MGYELPRSEYDLPFDDTPLAGLNIRVRSMSMGERLHVFFDLAPNMDDTPAASKDKQEQRAAAFIEHVVEWNVERGGVPLPVTVEALMSVAEPEHIGVIMTAWAKGRTHIPVPLEPASPATSLSEIPMTVQETTPEPVSSTAS